MGLTRTTRTARGAHEPHGLLDDQLKRLLGLQGGMDDVADLIKELQPFVARLNALRFAVHDREVYRLEGHPEAGQPETTGSGTRPPARAAGSRRIPRQADLLRTRNRPKPIKRLLATPTNTLRRPVGTPKGIAISTTTRQVQGVARRQCNLVGDKPGAVRGIGIEAQIIEDLRDRHVRFLGGAQRHADADANLALDLLGRLGKLRAGQHVGDEQRDHRRIRLDRILEQAHFIESPDPIDARHSFGIKQQARAVRFLFNHPGLKPVPGLVIDAADPKPVSALVNPSFRTSRGTL